MKNQGKLQAQQLNTQLKSQVKNLTEADLNSISGGTIKYPVIVRFAVANTGEAQASLDTRGSKVRIM